MNKVKKIAFRMGREIRSFFISFKLNKADKNAFSRIYKEARSHYEEKVGAYDFGDFVMPKWRSNMTEMERYFLDGFSFGFLNNRTIRLTMFVYAFGSWKKTQLEFIVSFFGVERAKRFLRENDIGRPLLNDNRFITSGNTTHHLYHLAKFFKETGVRPEEVRSVVEVGGGYGNMARLFKQLNPLVTYTILDLPIFSHIQLVYLKTLLGDKAVNLTEKDNGSIQQDKINLFPLDKSLLADLGQNIRCDLFVSTWALSESNKKMQSTIRDLDYFKAKHILLAYQKNDENFSYAEDIQRIGDNYRIIYNKETEYTPNNYYLFAIRR